MKPTLKALAADVRRVWSPPPSRAWSLADVAITKLLRAIEESHESTATGRNDQSLAPPTTLGHGPARENEP
jgi:hypothetical protein